MRDDLLPAQASVDWAVAQFPSLQERIDSWRSLNVHVEIIELPPDVPNNVMIAIPKEPLPLAFNVEVGAYINTIGVVSIYSPVPFPHVIAYLLTLRPTFRSIDPSTTSLMKDYTGKDVEGDPRSEMGPKPR